MLYLVFHQGDERGDDDTYTFLDQGRHLECDGFAATCRHKTEGIPSAGNAFNDIALNASEIRIPPILLQNKLKLICHFFLVIWPDSLYLKLDLILLENIVLNGVCNVETAAAFDVSGSRALPEGNSVHYGTRFRIYQFQFDMLLLSAHHLAGAVIIYVLRAEYGFAIAWTKR